MTLTEKVYGVLRQDEPIGQAWLKDVAGRFPLPPNGERLTQFELDCRDWGLVIGVAYGIARAEDPFEPEASVADRAGRAAREAYMLWAEDSDIFTSAAFKRDRESRPVPHEEALA